MEVLALSDCRNLTDHELINIIDNNTTLKKMKLRNCPRITGLGSFRISNLNELEELFIASNNKISNENIFFEQSEISNIYSRCRQLHFYRL